MARGEDYPRRTGIKVGISLSFVLFILYLIAGLYLVNLSMTFYEIPEFVTNFGSWIFLVAGALLVIASVSYLKPKKR